MSILRKITLSKVSLEKEIKHLRDINERLCSQLFSAITGGDIDVDECNNLLEQYCKENGYE